MWNKKQNLLYYFPRKEEIHQRLISALLDMWLASRLFVFPNTSAILGPVVHGWDSTTGAFTFPIPIEEFVFYITGFQFTLLVYVWSDESWLSRYKTNTPQKVVSSSSAAASSDSAVSSDITTTSPSNSTSGGADASVGPDTRDATSSRLVLTPRTRSGAFAQLAFIGALVFASIAYKTPTIFGNTGLLFVADTIQVDTTAQGRGANSSVLPEYFLFLVCAAIAPCIAVYPRVSARVNWRALSFTMLVLLLVSVVWEVTLGVRHGWWGYRNEHMLGIFIAPWHNLPIEAVMTWLLVTFITIFTYEFILSRTDTRKVAATPTASPITYPRSSSHGRENGARFIK